MHRTVVKSLFSKIGSHMFADGCQHKFQFIDMKEKELSKGEFNSVMQAVGGVDAMIDPNCKDKDLLALVTYISADERAEKVMENQSVIRQPIVRNGRQATVGYAPDVWKTWQ